MTVDRLPNGWKKPSHDSMSARVDRARFPGTGFCGRCGFTWNTVDPHSTTYNDLHGCFPLCGTCWTELGCPEARIEYYGDLVEQWEYQGAEVSEETKHQIMKAVANGG